MIQHLQDNLASIVGVILIIIILVIVQFFFAKMYVKDLSKKREAKGVAAMTDDETKSTIQVYRSASIQTAVMILLGYLGYLLGQFWV